MAKKGGCGGCTALCIFFALNFCFPDVKSGQAFFIKISMPFFTSVKKKTLGREDRSEVLFCNSIYSTFNIPAGGFLFFSEKRNKNACQKKLVPKTVF